jgi:hypothetical protein
MWKALGALAKNAKFFLKRERVELVSMRITSWLSISEGAFSRFSS